MKVTAPVKRRRLGKKKKKKHSKGHVFKMTTLELLVQTVLKSESGGVYVEANHLKKKTNQ